jgi:N-acylglucosamine-6-phosphate 2-epimerase
MKQKLTPEIKGLIVSCQAEIGNPFNDDDSVLNFAKCAYIGGASGIRTAGISRVSKILNEIDLPLIGLVKSKFNDGSVGITINENDFIDLCKVGCKIIAIDGTIRSKSNMDGYSYISYIKNCFPDIFIMADIATLYDAQMCEQAGADFISSTLNGYTFETQQFSNGLPNYNLIEQMLKYIKKPVIAEGRISNSQQASDFIKMGCQAVVVGSAITRPHIIVQDYVNKINK